ncbi:MAG: antibiotic biosynthesis monooxygenase [Candidatus Thiodiazotropha sp.]
MTYRVILESTAKAETIDSLFPFLDENLPNVRSFKGCLNVTILFDKDTNQMVFDEEWKSKEDHQAYIAFIESNGVLADLADFLQGPPKISYYERLSI